MDSRNLCYINSKSMLTYHYLHIYLKYSRTTLDALKKRQKNTAPKTYLCLDSQLLISKGTNLVGDSTNFSKAGVHLRSLRPTVYSCKTTEFLNQIHMKFLNTGGKKPLFSCECAFEKIK